MLDATTVYSQWTVFPDGFDPVAAGLTFVSVSTGDFNANSVLDAADIDALSDRLRSEHWWGTWLWHLEGMFDLDGDFGVLEDDHDMWVKDLAHVVR